jgi:hypothetical protein
VSRQLLLRFAELPPRCGPNPNGARLGHSGSEKRAPALVPPPCGHAQGNHPPCVQFEPLASTSVRGRFQTQGPVLQPRGCSTTLKFWNRRASFSVLESFLQGNAVQGNHMSG